MKLPSPPPPGLQRRIETWSRRIAVRGLALLAAVLASPGAAQAVAQAGSDLDTRTHAARAGSVVVGWAEFDRVLLDKHALSPDGREALAHLMRARVLERLAQESKLVVDDELVETRLNELEVQVVAAGEASSLAEYLRGKRISLETLREFTRIGLVQELLAARALGRRKGAPVTAEEQEMWLDQILADRGVEFPEPPWNDNVVARCGDLSIYVGEYARHLRTVLPDDDLRDACRHLVLEKKMRAMMPDLSGEALARAAEAELDRRRAVVRANPAYQGLTYEQVAHQRGLQLEALGRDPEVVATALSHVWVDRKIDEEQLRKLYADRRAYFDSRFGEALDCYAILLNASERPNEVVPRTFAKARKELEKLAPQLVDLETFRSAAVRFSEDPGSKSQRGALGWITRGSEVAENLRKAVFALHARGLDREHRLVGPLDLQDGVALVWVEAWRPAPGWSEMREFVHREARRLFVDEILPEGALVTYLDVTE